QPPFRTPPNRVVPPDAPYRAIAARCEKVQVFAWLAPHRRDGGARLHLDLRVNEQPPFRTPPNRIVSPDAPYRAIGARCEKVQVFAWLAPHRRDGGAGLHLDLRVNEQPSFGPPPNPFVSPHASYLDIGARCDNVDLFASLS